MIELFNFKIHVVKRLSDGEVFTVGDNTTYGIIKELCLKNSVMHVMFESRTYLYITDSVLKVIKTPLFTTEDGVEVFKGDIVWRTASRNNYLFVRPEMFDTTHWDIYLLNYGANVHKHFSTKEKAEEYIVMNKPCLSINDVTNCLIGYCSMSKNELSGVIEYFLKNKK